MNVTKGKWEAVENDHFIDIKVDGNPIAQVIANQYADVDKEQMRANARIMAASKEMAAMLKEIAISMECFHGVDTDSIFELLAKVKGEL